jgi:hypothetical protein
VSKEKFVRNKPHVNLFNRFFGKREAEPEPSDSPAPEGDLAAESETQGGAIAIPNLIEARKGGNESASEVGHELTHTVQQGGGPTGGDAGGGGANELRSDDSGGAAQFNPKEIAIDKSVPWQKAETDQHPDFAWDPQRVSQAEAAATGPTVRGWDPAKKEALEGGPEPEAASSGVEFKAGDIKSLDETQEARFQGDYVVRGAQHSADQGNQSDLDFLRSRAEADAADPDKYGRVKPRFARDSDEQATAGRNETLTAGGSRSEGVDAGAEPAAGALADEPDAAQVKKIDALTWKMKTVDADDEAVSSHGAAEPSAGGGETSAWIRVSQGHAGGSDPDRPVITGSVPNAESGGDRPTESLSLNFEKVKAEDAEEDDALSRLVTPEAEEDASGPRSLLQELKSAAPQTGPDDDDGDDDLGPSTLLNLSGDERPIGSIRELADAAEDADDLGDELDDDALDV